MKLRTAEHEGILFKHREGYSDLKTFQEVVVDPSLERLWRVLDSQADHYDLNFPSKTIRYKERDMNVWQSSWFPACVNIFGYEKD